MAEHQPPSLYVDQADIPPHEDMDATNTKVVNFTDPRYVHLGYFVYSPNPTRPGRAIFDMPFSLTHLMKAGFPVVEEAFPSPAVIDLYVEHQVGRMALELEQLLGGQA